MKEGKDDHQTGKPMMPYCLCDFAEVEASQDPVADDEGPENLLTNCEDTKWCVEFHGDENVKLSIRFKRPVTISGYGFKSANDCEWRNPVQWKLKVCCEGFKPNPETGGEDFIDEQTVAHDLWGDDRYALKRFPLEEKVTSDHFEFEFFKNIDIECENEDDAPLLQIGEVVLFA